MAYSGSYERNRQRPVFFGNLESSGKNQEKVREVNFGYEEPEGVVMTSLDFAINWVRKSSV